MSMFDSLLALGIFALGIRTAGWHLQNWQIREYRWDRVRAFFRTEGGRHALWNFWFFRGIFPRPKISGRVAMILAIFFAGSAFSIVVAHFIAFAVCAETVSNFCRNFVEIYWIWIAIFWERTIFLTMGTAVLISKIPVWIGREILFFRVKKLMKNSKNSLKIGITGSFGKSSTKAILAFLCDEFFGEKFVWKNPANENTEVAIARGILKFCKNKKQILIVEIGAYRRGEIAKVCGFLSPDFGILTGIGPQHLELFGSQKNIVAAKFELAEHASKKVFFPSDDSFLPKKFEEKNLRAEKIGVDSRSAKILKISHEKTEFEWRGERFVLPWGGKFFVRNAILAVETFLAICEWAERGDFDENLRASAQILSKIQPLERALKIEDFRGGKLLRDLYSANPDGVLAAIDHLAEFSGKKIFVGTPLLELGERAESVHRAIFEKLRDVGAEVFWMKSDFANLGQKICGKQFHEADLEELRATTENFCTGDAILCEGRLKNDILKLLR